MKKLVLYTPGDIDGETLFKLMKTLKEEAELLRLDFSGPYFRDDDKLVVYYEDDEIRTFIYIDNLENELDPDKIRATIKVLALIAMDKEEEIYVENI